MQRAIWPLTCLKTYSKTYSQSVTVKKRSNFTPVRQPLVCGRIASSSTPHLRASAADPKHSTAHRCVGCRVWSLFIRKS